MKQPPTTTTLLPCEAEIFLFKAQLMKVHETQLARRSWTGVWRPLLVKQANSSCGFPTVTAQSSKSALWGQTSNILETSGNIWEQPTDEATAQDSAAPILRAVWIRDSSERDIWNHTIKVDIYFQRRKTEESVFLTGHFSGEKETIIFIVLFWWWCCVQGQTGIHSSAFRLLNHRHRLQS